MAPTALTAHRPLHGNYRPCLLLASEGGDHDANKASSKEELLRRPLLLLRTSEGGDHDANNVSTSSKESE